jgi:hypothetical protein
MKNKVGPKKGDGILERIYSERLAIANSCWCRDISEKMLVCSRLTTLKNQASKIQGDMEAFKRGYWGGGY